jgi:hypothetical protein
MGSETNGAVTGWTWEPGYTGTFTVTNGTDVEIIFDYISAYYGQTLVVFRGTITSHTVMGGTGTWYDEDLGSYNHTWTGTKL